MCDDTACLCRYSNWYAVLVCVIQGLRSRSRLSLSPKKVLYICFARYVTDIDESVVLANDLSERKENEKKNKLCVYRWEALYTKHTNLI